MRAELLPEAFAGNMRALLGDEEYTSYIESFEEDWKPGLRANGLKISGGAEGHGALAAGASAMGGLRVLL